MRAEAAPIHEADFARRPPLWSRLIYRIRRRPKDSLAAAVAGTAALAILVNALFMQSGPHPAPIFANKAVVAVAPTTGPAAALLPRPRPGTEAQPAKVQARSEIVADIQRELTRRGFYDGAADGVYGPKTDAAIRDFEEAAGLRPSAEPNDVLLATIARSQVKAKPPATNRNDPIAALLASNPRILAVQRALTDFGYGPLKPNGIYDPETREAIIRFEHARKQAPTGQITERLVHDLAAMTGRPLE
jgi:peptidoglycan hydrolase-like protein with peptidoglycan-binding domain